MVLSVGPPGRRGRRPRGQLPGGGGGGRREAPAAAPGADRRGGPRRRRPRAASDSGPGPQDVRLVVQTLLADEDEPRRGQQRAPQEDRERWVPAEARVGNPARRVSVTGGALGGPTSGRSAPLFARLKLDMHAEGWRSLDLSICVSYVKGGAGKRGKTEAPGRDRLLHVQRMKPRPPKAVSSVP